MLVFKKYRRIPRTSEMAPWVPGVDMTGVSISASDRESGSPRDGDMIARNPDNHGDCWLVAAAYCAENFEYADIFERMPAPDKFKEVSAELDAAIDAELSEHTSIMTDETDTQAAMGHKAHK